jgi:hypothetical protein
MDGKEKDPIDDAEATVDESEIDDLFGPNAYSISEDEAVPGGTAFAGDAPTVGGGATSAAAEDGEGTEGGLGSEGVGGVSGGAEGPGAPDPEVEKEGLKDGEVQVGAEGVEDGDVTPAGRETPSEVETLKAQIANLTGLVERLSAGAIQPQVPVAPKQPDAAPDGPTLETLFTEVDLDEVLENKENFVKFFTSAMEIVKRQTRQETLAAVPGMVQPVMQQQRTIHDTVNQFYADNPELQTVKQYVSFVAKEVAAEHPDYDIKQVLDEAAVRVKKNILIPQSPTAPSTPGPKQRPHLPGGSKSVKAPAKTTSSLVDEINEIILD